VQWVETNPSNICIIPTDIRFLPPHGTTLKALIQMFAYVGWVGFLPPLLVTEKKLLYNIDTWPFSALPRPS
jgi:hypothetical protein